MTSHFIGDNVELPAGLHKYNFEFQLPAKIPTSYKSDVGEIRYNFKVAIVRSWSCDITETYGFTVINVVDLNLIQPSLKFPAKGKISKTFFLGFGSNPLFMSAEIPFSGFVNGQEVPISVKIDNASSVDVEKIKISLEQIVQYVSKSSYNRTRKTKEVVKTAKSWSYHGVRAKNKANAICKIVIPNVSPTNHGICSVIIVNYEIRVCAEVGGFHRSPTIKIPIAIGTVSLFESE